MKKALLNIVCLLLISLPGCLKDNLPVEYPKPVIGNSAEILFYLEETGDYINTTDAPSLVSAGEVFMNLDSFLVIDVRSEEKFYAGHIKSAKFISPDSLLSYLKKIDTENYKKIVLVSETGQSASYYTCLLRLIGFNNVYSMNFGMAYWHRDFAGKWFSSIGNYDLSEFTNYPYPKLPLTSLPEVQFNSGVNIKTKIESRIQLLLSQGFPEDSVEANQQYKSNALITMEEVEENFHTLTNMPYLVCYAGDELYLAGKLEGEKGHPAHTVHYWHRKDIRSINYLQTLPTDKEIFIYDYNGQGSAALTAYLRLLGYNAKSILFGANHFIYARVAHRMTDYAFSHLEIRNFEYE